VLQTGPNDAKRNAAAALRNISHEEQYVGAVVAAGAIRACVTVLQSGPDDAQSNTTAVLAHVSGHENHVEDLVAAGLITTILDAMHSMDTDGKFCAALALADVSDRLDVAVIASIVTPLVRELKKVADEKYEEDEFDATRALSKILRHEQHVDIVLEGGAVAALTRAQQNSSQRVMNEATIALDRITKVKRNRII